MSAALALYRRYRCKKLEDIVGQEQVTKPLRLALQAGKVAHGYLLTGPHGTGKTSVARIIAHQVNNFEYSDAHSYVDIIEIDAASNRRIDEIRELREKVHIAPAQGTYKVYIIDEVHMLTREAFNALLKTLEEPPAHAIFILATTEAHKIPATIISRTQQYAFKLVAEKQVVSHLSHIAAQEKIDVSPEALQLIAHHGKGSFRDSINLLDQVASAHPETITEQAVFEQLGWTSNDKIESLIQAVLNQDSAQVIQIVDEIMQGGSSAKAITDQLIDLSLETMKESPSAMLVSLINSLIDVHAAQRTDLKLLVTLIEHSLPTHDQNPSPTVNKPQTKRDNIAKKTTTRQKTTPQGSDDQPAKIAPTEKEEAIVNTDPKKATPQKTDAPTSLSQDGVLDWEAFLASIKTSHRSLYTTLRLAVAQMDKDEVIVGFRFPLHHKRISAPETAQEVTTLLTEYLKQPVRLSVHVDKTIPLKSSPKRRPEPKLIEGNEATQKVIDTFGGGEVISYE